MAISPFLQGEHFDQETLRVLGVACEQVCLTLRAGDCDDDSQASDSKQSRRTCENRRAQS
jgi:hypothetical protein